LEIKLYYKPQVDSKPLTSSALRDVRLWYSVEGALSFPVQKPYR
jgi:hypothetical protein